MSIISLNVLSTTNPLIIFNTGNVAISNINVTAYNLEGETHSEVFDAGNFSINIADACEGDLMSNSTSTEITGASVSIGEGSYEELYYCIEEVPVLSIDTYLSQLNWVITSIS